MDEHNFSRVLVSKMVVSASHSDGYRLFTRTICVLYFH